MTRLPSCRDCRWWEERLPVDDGRGGTPWGTCSRFGIEADEGAMATAYGDFLTASDFSCVQWMARSD